MQQQLQQQHDNLNSAAVCVAAATLAALNLKSVIKTPSATSTPLKSAQHNNQNNTTHDIVDLDDDDDVDEDYDEDDGGVHNESAASAADNNEHLDMHDFHDEDSREDSATASMPSSFYHQQALQHFQQQLGVANSSNSSSKATAPDVVLDEKVAFNC